MKFVVLGVVVAAIIAAGISVAPDLARYLKMRSM